MVLPKSILRLFDVYCELFTTTAYIKGSYFATVERYDDANVINMLFVYGYI